MSSYISFVIIYPLYLFSVIRPGFSPAMYQLADVITQGTKQFFLIIIIK